MLPMPLFAMTTTMMLMLLITTTTTTNAFSAYSSFVGRQGSSSNMMMMPPKQKANRRSFSSLKSSLVMYENSNPESSRSSQPEHHNVWNVLSRTEEWISNVLSSKGGGAGSSSPSSKGPGGTASNNPYARKEVSYVCDLSMDTSMIVANIFKRLKEVREMGDTHGREEFARKKRMMNDQGSYRPHTLRQTQVIVIPNNPMLCTNFTKFDTLVDRINRARRNARDYVTDLVLEQAEKDAAMDDEDDDDDDDESIISPWSVSVTCAHLHPKYGERTLQQQLEDMKAEEEEEVDVHYQEYLEKRRKARQSPYPTLVVEVRAMPPPDFSQAPPPPRVQLERIQQQQQQQQSDDKHLSSSSSSDQQVSAKDIQKLEALFGRTATMDHPIEGKNDDDDSSTKKQSKDDAFYQSIGQTINSGSGIMKEELTAMTPIQWAQQWVASNVQNCLPTASFTESDARHVDHAYEFIFTNLAMMHQQDQQQQQASLPTTQGPKHQFFLVLPHLFSSSATSFEKLSGEVTNIMECLPDLISSTTATMTTPPSHIHLSTYHPEHIDSNRRSPIPILCLEWSQQQEGNFKDEQGFS